MEQTFITKEGSTNDLHIAYEFNAILEAFTSKEENLTFKEKEENLPCKGKQESFAFNAKPENLAFNAKEGSLHNPRTKCSYTEKCGKDITLYCCGVFMCQYCAAKHNAHKEYHEGKTDVAFDDKIQELRIVCKKHSTYCTHCSDKTFLCVYCLNRTHKNYTKHTIENEADRIRKALNSESRKMKHVEDVLKATEDSIMKSKRRLVHSLRDRKLKCLCRYIEFLNNEEEVIINQFENLSNKHKRQYPSCHVAEYYKNNASRNDIELAIEKNVILGNLRRSSLDNLTFLPVTVSLSDQFYFNNPRPLGDIQMFFGAELPLSDSPFSTFKSDIAEVNSENLLVSLTVMLSDLLHYSDVTRGNECTIKASMTDVEGDVSIDESLHSCRKKQKQLNLTHKTLNKSDKSDKSDHDSTDPSGTPNSGNGKGTVIGCISSERGEIFAMQMVELPGIQEVSGIQKMDETLEGDEMHEAPVIQQSSKAQRDLTKACLKKLAKRGIEYIKELIYAAENDKLRLLLHERADIIHMSSNGHFTPFLHATIRNNVDAMKMLLEHGESICVHTDQGHSALHIAARLDNAETVEWLLKSYPILLNTTTNMGSTPLLHAAHFGSLTSLRLLLKYGANTEVLSKVGNTPLQVAKRQGKEGCVKELQKSSPHKQ